MSDKWVEYAQIVTLTLGAVGTVWGVRTNAAVNDNTAKISALQEQLQLSKEFAAGVEATRPFIVAQDKVTGMLELVRLYALASTPQQKLSVLEIARDSGQTAAVGNLAMLVKSESFYLRPSNPSEDSAVQSLNSIISAAESALQQSTPSPKPSSLPNSNSVRLALTIPAPVATVFNDAPLTHSANRTVAASATLVAELNSEQKGWVFVGDTYASAQQEATRHLFAATSTTSAKTSDAIAIDRTLTACKDINVRSIPFLPDGSLGRPIGLAPANSQLTVVKPPPPYDTKPVIQYQGKGRVSGAPILAYWAYVNVTTSATSAPSTC